MTIPESSDLRQRRAVGRLARLGFRDAPAARRLLQDMALPLWDCRTDSAASPQAASVLAALGRAPDQDLALRTLAKLADADAGQNGLWQLLTASAVTRARLTSLLGASIALGEHLIRFPEQLAALHSPPPTGPVVASTCAQMAGRILDAVGADAGSPITGSLGKAAPDCGPEAVELLRAAYRRELTTVAAWDLAAEIDVETACTLLTALADGVLAASLAIAAGRVARYRTPSFRLAVVAMGKAGGNELNYVSDVDVLFIAEPAQRAHPASAEQPAEGTDPTAGAAEGALRAAQRLASETMRVAGAAAWQVDAGLRPEGRDGPLVRTLGSYTSYYHRWASTWEFQALLKARPAAGDLALGQAFVEAVAPLVWSAAERPTFVADVRAMRRRVVAHLPAKIADREIKLGAGGLRDVEFAVQLLALVHGRADESLRDRSTLGVLSALRDGGYVGRDDAISLADAYGFLRVAEHRLQLWRMQRTHTVPDGADDRRVLARAMGFRPDARGDAVAVFDAEWSLHATEVRRLHEQLFYRPLLESVARLPSEDFRLTPEAAARRLSALGFTRPTQALSHIQALTTGVSRRAAIQRQLLPMLLRELADTPDPDVGLLGYRQISDALGTTPWFLRLLRDEGQVASRLALILGSSRYVTGMLVRAPEALQMLASDDQLQPRGDAQLTSGFTDAAGRQLDPTGTAGAGVVRSLRRLELLRIAFADVLGLLDVDDVAAALSSVAEATIAATLELALDVVGRTGWPFTVVAMGRLGGREVGYGSDADVLFVVDGPADQQIVPWAIRVAETLRRLLAAPSPDPVLMLDADLRPEGRSGPLVRSLGSYHAYYRRWSSPWEAQALLRARPIAGDVDLGQRFCSMIDPVRYPDAGLSAEQLTEIRRIKGRVEAERLPRGADPATHLKLGRGGLADVEWTAQLLQLRWAGAHPPMRTTETIPALRAAATAGLITNQDTDQLMLAWRLASRARNAITLVRDKAGDQLPTQGPVLRLLARSGPDQLTGSAAEADTGRVVDEYRRASRHARQVVERVFYDRE